MSLKEIKTIWPISVKIGMEMLLRNGKVLSWVSTQYPNPQGQKAQNSVHGGSAASTMHLGEYFLTNVVLHPFFSQSGSHVWPHNLDTEWPVPYVLQESWSITQYLTFRPAGPNVIKHFMAIIVALS